MFGQKFPPLILRDATMPGYAKALDVYPIEKMRISHSQFLHLSDFPLLDTVIYKSLFSAMRFHYSEIWSTIRLQSGLIEHEDSTCLSTSLKVKLMFLSIELLLVALRACDGTTRQ